MEVTSKADFFRQWSEKSGRTQIELREIYSSFLDVVDESINESDATRTIIPDIGFIKIKPVMPYIGYDAVNKKPIPINACRRGHIKFTNRFTAKFQ